MHPMRHEGGTKPIISIFNSPRPFCPAFWDFVCYCHRLSVLLGTLAGYAYEHRNPPIGRFGALSALYIHNSDVRVPHAAVCLDDFAPSLRRPGQMPRYALATTRTAIPQQMVTARTSEYKDLSL